MVSHICMYTHTYKKLVLNMHKHACKLKYSRKQTYTHTSRKPKEHSKVEIDILGTHNIATSEISSGGHIKCHVGRVKGQSSCDDDEYDGDEELLQVDVFILNYFVEKYKSSIQKLFIQKFVLLFI